VLSSGDLLDHRYRLDDQIATGGMGDVWRATDVLLGRVVAVKVLRSSLVAEPDFAARFYGEARMLATFRHPGVVEVYDYGETDRDSGDHRLAYLVMAYVDGEPLSTRLRRDGALTAAETMSVVSQAARALHAAHDNGIVHRDVKPGNLLITPDGAVVLVDFGVARSAAVASVTGVNDIVGTALYMAPEQISKAAVSPATDVYALGAVAYHCLAGHPPFDGENPLEVALRHLDEEPPPLPDDVPAPIRAIVARAMAKAPDDRYPSARAMAEAATAAMSQADATAAMSQADATAAMGMPHATTAVHQPDAAAAMGGPDATTAMHQPDAAAAMGGPDATTAMHQPDATRATGPADATAATALAAVAQPTVARTPGTAVRPARPRSVLVAAGVAVLGVLVILAALAGLLTQPSGNEGPATGPGGPVPPGVTVSTGSDPTPSGTAGTPSAPARPGGPVPSVTPSTRPTATPSRPTPAPTSTGGPSPTTAPSPTRTPPPEPTTAPPTELPGSPSVELE
jgi:serine/threonine-protein kinase